MKKYILSLLFLFVAIPAVAMAQTYTFQSANTSATLSDPVACNVRFEVDAVQYSGGIPSDDTFTLWLIVSGSPVISFPMFPDSGYFERGVTISSISCSGSYEWRRESISGGIIASGVYPAPGSTPTPISNPLTGFYSSGGDLNGPPTPFDLPETDPDADLAIASLWNAEVLYNSVRAFLTVFAIARRNTVIQVFFIAGAFIMVVLWIIRFVGNRERNV